MRQNNSPRKHNIITGGARRDGRTDRRRTVVQPVGRLALPIASGASKAVHFRVPCFFGRLGCFQYGRIAEENRSLVTLSITCTYRQQGVDRQTDRQEHHRRRQGGGVGVVRLLCSAYPIFPVCLSKNSYT